MSNTTPPHDIYALAGAIRAGALSAEQREQLVALLLRVDTAAALVRRARELSPPDADAQAHYTARRL